MQRMFTGLFCLLTVAFASREAAAQRSVGTPSDCKKQGAAKAACIKCVGSGQFWQVKEKVCGMAEGMHKSVAFKTEPPPPKPASMPKSTFVTVPAGTFKIGATPDEEGVDESKEVFKSAVVTISRAFTMKATEVTQAEWYFVMGQPTASYDKKCGLDCPVGHVSWRQALEYLNALSKKEGIEECYDLGGPLAKWKGLDCKGYRLPTEAEWEYAARGGTATARYGELNDIAWYTDNSGGVPHPVGKKAANAYGLFDMLGNHWEWTWDAEDFNAPLEGKVTDPVCGGFKQEEESKNRMLRGGGFDSNKIYVRAAHRHQSPPASGDARHGFRPVRPVIGKK